MDIVLVGRLIRWHAELKGDKEGGIFWIIFDSFTS